MPCLLTCNKCCKQYVGQTVDEFRRRWNNYKSNDRKFQRLEPCMQEHLFSHFSMAGHDGFLNDVSITFIDKTDPSDRSLIQTISTRYLTEILSKFVTVAPRIYRVLSKLTIKM